LQTYSDLMSGFAIFFGLFVFALLVEWVRIELLETKREQSRRQGKVASRASEAASPRSFRITPQS